MSEYSDNFKFRRALMASPQGLTPHVGMHLFYDEVVLRGGKHHIAIANVAAEFPELNALRLESERELFKPKNAAALPNAITERANLDAYKAAFKAALPLANNDPIKAHALVMRDYPKLAAQLRPAKSAH